MGRKSVIDILVIVFAAIDVVFLIFAAIYLTTASKKVTSLQLTPDFSETEIGISSEYTFTVTATPAKASLKKVKCVCDDPNSTFEMDKDGKATLTTGATEGTVTVYVTYKKVESNKLTFNLVDLVAQAQAEAEAEAAAAQAEAEAAAAEAAAAEEEAVAAEVKEYVKMTGDNVNVRAENNTDCSVLGKAKKGEVFEKVEEVDDWTHIMYNGQDGYIKTEYLTSATEDEFLNGSTSSDDTDTTEEKKEETTDTSADDAAKKAEEEAKAAEEAATKAAEEAAAQQEALAAAAAAQTYTINCADGVQSFSKTQYDYIKAHWSYTGDWEACAHKHTKAELIQVCEIEGGVYQ